jgi:hypothetical protein
MTLSPIVSAELAAGSTVGERPLQPAKPITPAKHNQLTTLFMPLVTKEPAMVSVLDPSQLRQQRTRFNMDGCNRFRGVPSAATAC